MYSTGMHALLHRTVISVALVTVRDAISIQQGLCVRYKNGAVYQLNFRSIAEIMQQSTFAFTFSALTDELRLSDFASPVKHLFSKRFQEATSVRFPA